MRHGAHQARPAEGILSHYRLVVKKMATREEIIKAVEQAIDEELTPIFGQRIEVRPVVYVKDREHVARVTKVYRTPDANHAEITIAGDDDDIRAIELMLMGVGWVRRGVSNLEVSDAYHTPPGPIEDPKLAEHWPVDKPVVPPSVQYSLFVDEEEHEKQARANRKLDFRAIYVSSVTAYAGGNDVYSVRAKKLEDGGFVCLRSRRGSDGKYHEVWYLPSCTSAEGELKGKTTEEIVDWVMRYVGAGSISVEGAHWGAVVD